MEPKVSGLVQSITYQCSEYDVFMYLIIQQCSMHIKITSVCGSEGEIEAFKAMSVKLETETLQTGTTAICDGCHNQR